MKNKLILFLIFIELGIIGFGIYIYPSVFKLEARVEYRTSAEVGQEIVILFNQPVIIASFEKHFLIDPEINGELTWLDSNRELHIVPVGELEDDTIYQLDLGGVRSFALTRFKKKSFSFYIPPNKPVLVVLNPELQILPLSKDILFEKTDGTLVEINQARITEGKYIDIDSSDMLLTVFNNGQPIVVYEVAAIGNPWSRPTPKGSFSVLHKEENHFSRKSYVWMPWSIHFYGDYYIHEIPYWFNGQKVTSKYSGGCVRLPIDAAKLVYDWAEIGMPVLIY
ncbi:MAG: L,D-transpeptidase [Patescibacteria group bacterium]